MDADSQGPGESTDLGHAEYSSAGAVATALLTPFHEQGRWPKKPGCT